MRFKDLLSVTKNKRNKQVNMSLKKKELKKLGCSVDDLLNMKIKRKTLRKLK